jgi:secondary thiamine-phosphate synthase enzyme
MKQHQHGFRVATTRGITEITDDVADAVRASGIRTGLCTVYIRHTSASLIIQENADPAVRRDLEAFLTRLIPDGDPLHTHTAEGDDDMPSHIKAAITRTSEQIPIKDGALALGTWQGIYVWDHRNGRHQREIVVHLLGE